VHDYFDPVPDTQLESNVLFYSKVDAASSVVQRDLKELEHTMGAENLQVNSHDFFTDVGGRNAELPKVGKVPTVVINGAILENPSKNQIFDKVNDAITPTPRSSRSDFLTEPLSKLIYDALASRTG